MRIGVVPNLDRHAGGVYQYAATMLEALRDLGTGDEFVVFTYGGEFLPEAMTAPGPVVPLRRSAAGARGLLATAAAKLTGDSADTDPAWRAFFDRHGVDLLIFTADNDLAYRTGLPYVVAIHDIQHRLHPEFPEVSADGEWDRREQRMRPLIEKATAVLVDSEVGREDILRHYGDTGIAPEAVRPLPFLPAHYLGTEVTEERLAAVRAKYDLEAGGFLFYPAQLWPHKNHARLVEALALLARDDVRIPLVLVGSNEGALRQRIHEQLLSLAAEQGVTDLVRYLGYVPDEDISALYADALALVMPTFFGPTNIPVLEAFQFGCPVITSDIRGIREHVGDAALLVDPGSAPAIAQGIRRIATEPDLRESLVVRGRRWLSEYSQDDYRRLLREAIEEAGRRIRKDGQ